MKAFMHSGVWGRLTVAGLPGGLAARGPARLTAAVLGAAVILGLAGSPLAAQEADEPEADEPRMEREEPDVEVVRPEAPEPLADHPSVHVFRGATGGSHLGIYVQDVGDSAVNRLDLSEQRGALVTNVLEDSPAEEAGLRDDDVIVGWEGIPVVSVAQLQRHLRETPPGRDVRLEVIRDGNRRTVEVTLEAGRSGYAAFGMGGPSGFSEERLERVRERGERARARAEAMEEWSESFGGGDGYAPFTFFRMDRARMGVRLQSLSPELAAYFGLEDRTGALVSSVREDSPAEEAGLRAGDVILSIGGEQVEDPGDAARAVSEADDGPVEVRLVRDRDELTLTVELPEGDTSGGANGWSVYPFEDGRVYQFGPDGHELHIRIPELHVEPVPGDPRRIRVAVPDAPMAPLDVRLPSIILDGEELVPMPELSPDGIQIFPGGLDLELELPVIEIDEATATLI